ncbi:MAG: ABC transporter substrate-binding protein [Pseudochelatococcus sp.]|jgi:putative spermidine/putrescine transport system substrate-binding protein|uniref:ABC transporter substrate-binding protein n=1 Tax=Pseudochelatococcus sp. TaxID=2020869 RepID=UPI003D8F9424
MKHASAFLVAAGILTAATSAAQARDFTIAGWGGVYQDAQKEAYFKPFATDKGLKLTETTYLGGLAELKAMADSGKATWDLVIVEGADLQIGCDEGLFEQIDWSAIPTKGQLNPNAVQDCGAGNVVIGNGLAYNADAFSTPPADWRDFFDTEKFPGKRGVRNSPRMNLEYALLADGVPPDQVYKVLATPEGVDRAFAQFDRIRNELQFWEAGSQPVEWLSAGNVALSTAYNGRIISAQAEGKPLQFVWKHHVYNIDSWAIPANSPYKDEALAFIGFVSNAEPQAKFSSLIPYGPTNNEAAGLIPADILVNIPAGNNTEEALFLSDAFWIDHGDELTERWNNWSTR